MQPRATPPAPPLVRGGTNPAAATPDARTASEPRRADIVARREPVAAFYAVDTATEAPAEPTPPPATPSAGDEKLTSRVEGLEHRLDRLLDERLNDRTAQLERAAWVIQQAQADTRIRDLEQQVQSLKPSAKGDGQPPDGPPTSAALTPQGAAAAGASSPAEAPGAGAGGNAPAQPAPPVLHGEPNESDPDSFSIEVRDAELPRVLDMLSRLAGRNIMVGGNVTGKVSANLQDVTIDEALDALVRTQGYVAEADGRFIYVMTPAEADVRRRLTRKLVTKIYRPHFISVKDLQALITPLMTPTVSKIAVTNPAETGIATDPTGAGGDAQAQSDALLVQDYAEVVSEIDGIVAEMDVPPLQVVIEAVILQVNLTEDLNLGVNFAVLNDNQLLVVGNGNDLLNSTGFPSGDDDGTLTATGEFVANTFGLKYGFLRSDVSTFIRALETIADTNLVAAPQLRVLNRQRADLIIGQQLSYSTVTQNPAGSSIQNVEFLEVGTKLNIRPYISPDGMIRLEVHPELSSAEFNNLNLPDKTTTEVTTNVMVRDGTTIVLGGLIDEQVEQRFDRVPLLGALPVVGNLFRNRNEGVRRRETIVLITPRIVRDDEAEAVGATVAAENDLRHDHFRDNLLPLGRLNLARLHYEAAVRNLHEGDLEDALEHVEHTLRLNKNDLEALRLRDEIEAAIAARNRRLLPWSGRLWPQEGTKSAKNEARR
ncbi:MAG: hypothetical protein KY476_22780 [Planctomycetes bacterium]|nr:hypothetical protein [Planctomycetota bacterium]